MYIFSDFYFSFLIYIEEECYSVVILAKSSDLFHAKISRPPAQIFLLALLTRLPLFHFTRLERMSIWVFNNCL